MKLAWRKGEPNRGPTHVGTLCAPNVKLEASGRAEAMAAKKIMIQGTGSNVGKSVMAAALCRYFHEEGFRVAPFKAQNMSNNSFVTAGGGEIGRAQAFQAQVVGVAEVVLHARQGLGGLAIVAKGPGLHCLELRF